jgi:hypothetical protein
MNSKPPQRFTGLAVAIILAGLMIGAGIFAASYLGTATTVTKTITNTISTTTTTTIVSSASIGVGPLFYTSGASPEGLQLQVTLNSSSIQSDGAMTAQIELLNTLNRNVSLSVPTNQNISAWDGVDFLCDENPTYSLVGYALFDGHFAAGNISAAGSPLQLFPPLVLPCPTRTATGLNVTTFLPNSDETMLAEYGLSKVTTELNATTGYCVTSTFATYSSVNCGASPGLLGYWTPGPGISGNATLTSKAFAYFPSGEYTLVAADDWNQYVYAYFTVL